MTTESPCAGAPDTHALFRSPAFTWHRETAFLSPAWPAPPPGRAFLQAAMLARWEEVADRCGLRVRAPRAVLPLAARVPSAAALTIALCPLRGWVPRQARSRLAERISRPPKASARYYRHLLPVFSSSGGVSSDGNGAQQLLRSLGRFTAWDCPCGPLAGRARASRGSRRSPRGTGLRARRRDSVGPRPSDRKRTSRARRARRGDPRRATDAAPRLPSPAPRARVRARARAQLPTLGRGAPSLPVSAPVPSCCPR
jgi:hypothetical protein